MTISQNGIYLKNDQYEINQLSQAGCKRQTTSTDHYELETEEDNLDAKEIVQETYIFIKMESVSKKLLQDDNITNEKKEHKDKV